MRVSLVISNYDAFGGGAERWTHRHAVMLLERGHEVHLVSRRFRGVPDGALCAGVNVRSGPRRRMSFGDLAGEVLADIESDVVHDMGDGWHADLFMPHHGTRRGTFKHNARHLPPIVQRARRFANKWVPRYREFRALERKQYDLADHRLLYLAVSNMVREHMRKYYHVPDHRIRVVYNGVDTATIRPADDPAARRRFRWNVGVENETLFLTVAHNFRLKGLDTILRSMATLARARANVKLVVVGDGAVGQYQAIARSMGCDDLVKFVGNQPDPLPYYQAADVFLLPTYYDPCSLVVLEAMSAGLPIVTSRHNGVHELMMPEVQGIILDDPSDDAELTAAMDAYLDPERRRETGRAARSLAVANSADVMIERHLAIYDEIVGRESPAALAAADPAPMPTAAPTPLGRA